MITPPQLPAGHKHLWTPERAQSRGYWLVLDEKGYEYAFGHFSRTSGESVVSIATQPDGTMRKWIKDLKSGQVSETTPSTCASRWIDSVPGRLRAPSPWALPNGQDSSTSSEIRRAVMRWTNNPNRGQDALLLYGPPGTGKSQTAVWAGLLLAAQGIDGEWLHLPTGVQQMRHSYSGDRQEYEAMMQRWLRAPFLVVDDLGAEIGGKDVAELVYRVADARYNDALATVWTTNLSPLTLTQSGIDPRTASRIGAGVSIELGGKDRRAR